MTRADDHSDVSDEATTAIAAEPSADEHAAPPAQRPVREPLIGRHFTQPGQDVYAQIEWTYRTAAITSDTGDTIFEQSDIETPSFWSQTATNIVASKYFWGEAGTPQRETSMKTLVDRVVETITHWGRTGGYFSDGAAASAFAQELRYLLINQYAAFNSPVWFNVGIEETPQCSACFINSVDDTMESIMDLAKREALLFKWGSGTGSNLSTLRSSKESLTGGGKASGPVSFMRGYDAFANVIKSGGKTRRAAKMIILDADHPDVIEFINCKADEERKAWALIDAGYDGSLNGDAYSSVSFQNANHSVRVADEFMQAVEANGMWSTREVVTSEVVEQIPARDILRAISAATHQCGDPGMQFDTVINDWHTCSNTDRIYASNPCSEYMFLDDTACNLASLNLLKFYDLETHEFDVESYRHACRVMITAQEILVSNASYPSPLIGENSEKYRPLGLGYTNLGALLMARGLPYDSVDGRALAAAVTALMTGEAYLQSARVAERIGPFSEFAANREPFLRVMRKHQAAVGRIDGLAGVPDPIQAAAEDAWRQAVELGEAHGYRNAQATVLAPTGTIAFMMDCDTTGVEPDISLVKFKNLSGGGYFKIVNRTVPAALRRLGYAEDAIERIGTHIDETGTIEGRGRPQHRAPGHLRLRLQGPERPAQHRPVRSHPHARRGPAVPLRRRLQDRQRARAHDRRRDHADLHRRLEARRQGRRHLPRQLQAHPAPGNRRAQRRRRRGPGLRARTLAAQRRTGRPRKRPVAARLSPPPTPRRAPGDDPQVHDRRARGLHDHRRVRGRQARRGLRPHLQGRLGRLRPDGRRRHAHLGRAAIRRAALDAGQEVRPHALRTQRLDPLQGHPPRRLDPRLRLPLDGRQVPQRRLDRHRRQAGPNAHVARRGQTRPRPAPSAAQSWSAPAPASAA